MPLSTDMNSTIAEKQLYVYSILYFDCLGLWHIIMKNVEYNNNNNSSPIDNIAHATKELSQNTRAENCDMSMTNLYMYIYFW